MLFSDQIFEAIVVDVDYQKGICTISPLEASSKSNITDVPLPYYATNGNSGIFISIKKGTRVLAMHTSVRSREATVIAGLIPKANLYSDSFGKGKSLDTPTGTIPYPDMTEGKVVIRGNRGGELTLNELGDVISTTANGGGLFLKRNDARTAMTLAAEDIVEYSNGFKLFSGPVRRMSGIERNIFSRPDLSQIPLFADPSYPCKTIPLGFFTGNRPLRRSYNRRKRNPEISEYRMIINEFSTDYMFTGFDDEVARVKGNLSLYQQSETFDRNREPGNTLHLAEHELIEIIGGNVVDINGNILDINYRPLNYGGENGSVPTNSIEINYDRAKRISRRGIGYHFQLATNTSSTDPSSNVTNFVYDIDKEGVIKLNIPASSNTGNIPFPSKANYTAEGDSVAVTYENNSTIEPVPVTLRNEHGEIVFPDKKSQGISKRRTGIRYSTLEGGYFPSEGDGTTTSVRINPTKYHNMYSAAERLIANKIKIINIPQRYTDVDGMPEGLPISKPFEVPVPPTLNTGESDSIFRDILPEGKSDFPTYMSVIAVEPGAPAIYSGGGEDGDGVGTLIAGKLYIQDDPYSNDFSSKLEAGQVTAKVTDGVEPAIPAGGKSMHFNSEGSIEASVGKDNFDNKSLMLDTAGSIISWLGKDRNGRSLVMQTDGEVLFNIGGSYEGSGTEDRVMNKGRFDLRVNVVDKKFVGYQFGTDIPDRGGNPGSDSDFIISISEDGFIIAGMKSQTPMIIRNDGPILIESASSDVTLKGMNIKTVGPKGTPKSEKPPTRN